MGGSYSCLMVRREGKKATIAIGHTLLVIVYHVLADEKDYEELGGNYFDQWDRQTVQKRLMRRFEKLGYQVSLTPTEPAAEGRDDHQRSGYSRRCWLVSYRLRGPFCSN